jgi:hypothetical protein
MAKLAEFQARTRYPRDKIRLRPATTAVRELIVNRGIEGFRRLLNGAALDQRQGGDDALLGEEQARLSKLGPDVDGGLCYWAHWAASDFSPSSASANAKSIRLMI